LLEIDKVHRFHTSFIGLDFVPSAFDVTFYITFVGLPAGSSAYFLLSCLHDLPAAPAYFLYQKKASFAFTIYI